MAYPPNGMGWCQEFGPRLGEDCDHPMTATGDACRCPACGVVCTGRFAGCERVWAAAPPAPPTPAARPAAPAEPRPVLSPTVLDTAPAPLGDVRHALDALRAEIEALRAAEVEPVELTAVVEHLDRPPLRGADLVPTYEALLDVTAARRRRPWWKRHRAQHLGP